MRLNEIEKAAIKSACAKVLLLPHQIFLFGSRLDMRKKGGDIDLLLLCESEDKDNVINLKTRILLEIFKLIPEQKIDITIATESELNSDEFLLSISEAMEKL